MFIRRLPTVGVVVLVAFLMFTGSAMAAGSEYRSCATSSTCTVGEFLYDDSYVPITTATCTLTSRYPNDSVFLNAVAMSSDTDGWYSYDISTGTTEGVYRSQICCTAGSDYLCLDKTFEVAAASGASLTAADIWSYPSRSLTSFGTLVADIWSYSSRSLNSVASIWTADDRTLSNNTLSDGGSLATTGNVDEVKSKVTTIDSNVNNINSNVDTINTNTSTSTNSQDLTKIENKLDSLSSQVYENNLLLEEVVNEPIIKTVIEEGTSPSLEAKIRATREIANQLYSDTQQLKGRVGLIASSWSTLPAREAQNEVSLISKTLGSSTAESSPETLVGQITWLNQVWSSPIISQLAIEAGAITDNTTLAQQMIRTFGKSPELQEEFEVSLTTIQKLESLIGNSSDTKKSTSLFGYLKELEYLANAFDEYALALDELLENWDSYQQIDREKAIASLSRKIFRINVVPDALTVVDQSFTEKNDLQNKALALRAIVSVNQMLLAQNPEDSSNFVWLENGSVVFKSLVTNPSASINQTVPIKYYLPKELGKEDIISIEDDLSVEYDQQEDALFISGEVELGPEKTRTFTVETQDIWSISDEEILTVRKQTETLFQPLKNTSYFAQGATLKADIDVSLDKVIRLRNEAQTPEARIRAYRLGQIEMNAARDQLESLKTLVSSAGSVGTLFGFVGGVQTIAVWGLVIILVAGFVFLGLYIKLMAGAKQAVKEKIIKKKPTAKKAAAAADKHHQAAVTNIVSDPTASAPPPSLWKRLKTSISSKFATITGRKKSHHSMMHNLPPLHRGVVFFIGFLTVVGFILIMIIFSSAGTPLLSPLPGGTNTENLFAHSDDDINTITDKRIAAQKQNEAASANTKLAESNLVIISDNQQVLGTYTTVKVKPTIITVLIPNEASFVKVYEHPSLESKVITKIWTNKKMTKVSQIADWTGIEVEVEKDGQNFTEGWIPAEQTSDPTLASKNPN
jgi:hypothetical protein